MSLLEIKNLHASVDGKNILKGLHLTVNAGEVHAIMGPNGSGKSTLLRMVAGLERITAGEIAIGGRVVNNLEPKDRDIAMVFQNYALFPHMTVSENLAFPLEVRKRSKSDIEERVKKALDMVELGAFGNRRPGQLSGGQQQRVAVARALVFEPKLVLMDEPLGALDKQLREQMQYEIKHIHENLEVTVVYVTHDQSEALTMSNRIAVFNDGIIQQLAAPEDLYELPENAFVAQFIGENNRLVGTVKGFTGKNCTVQVENGQTVEALAVNVRKEGEHSPLSLRPERVFVRPEPGSCPNVFDATVEELIYLGDHVRTRVNLLGHNDFIIKIPNSAGHQHLQTGETVKVGWQAEDCRALDYL